MHYSLMESPSNANDSALCGETRDECFLFYFIVCGVVGGAICAAGLLGNALSLLILHRVGKKNSVSVFLLKVFTNAHYSL